MRIILLLAFGGVVLLLPETVSAQAYFVPCGGPGQPMCEFCHLVLMGNLILAWLILVLTVVAGLIFAYAGLKLVTSGGNPEAKNTAKSMFVNVIVGYLLVLSSWLIIDTLMRMLANQAEFTENGVFGPWNRIECVGQERPSVIRWDIPVEEYNANVAGWQARISDGQIVGDPNAAPALPIEGDCSPQNLQGAGMTQQQAQAFSCIAMAESGCRVNAQNPVSSARGVFQVVRGLNTPCHNLNLSQCTAAANAAGFNISGDLNCSTAFRGGTGPDNPSRPRAGMEDLWNACNAAADDFNCNAAAARCLYEQDNAGYAPWLGNPGQDHHRAQRACVARYGQS